MYTCIKNKYKWKRKIIRMDEINFRFCLFLENKKNIEIQKNKIIDKNNVYL